MGNPILTYTKFAQKNGDDLLNPLPINEADVEATNTVTRTTNIQTFMFERCKDAQWNERPTKRKKAILLAFFSGRSNIKPYTITFKDLKGPTDFGFLGLKLAGEKKFSRNFFSTT